MIGLVDEGVHHPEFDKLDVSGLKIIGLYPSLHSTPSGSWVQESSCGVQARGPRTRQGIKIIGTLLGGVIGQIKGGQVNRLVVGQLSVGKNFLNQNLPHVVVGLHGHIVLDMGGCQGRVPKKQRVNIVPTKVGSVVTVGKAISQAMFRVT